MKKKSKIILIVIIVLGLGLSLIGGKLYLNYIENIELEEKKQLEEKQKEIKEKVEKHYNEYVKTNSLNIADYGDVYVCPTNPNKNQDEITKTVYEISKESFPLVCGGDHSITYGSFRGFHKAIQEKYPDYEVGIIHFDAHLDVEKEYLESPH